MQNNCRALRRTAPWTDIATLTEFTRHSPHRFFLYNSRVFLLLCSLLLGGWSDAARAQTAYAPGGLFVHPTAYTPKAHKFSLYAAAFTQDQAQGINNSYYPLSFTYTPTDRLQVTALLAYHQAADEPSHTHLGTFLKYQLAPQTSSHPAFAIAGSYAGRDHLESAIAGVASHRFVHNGRVLTTAHLGIKWGRTSDEEGNKTDVGGFVGLQVPIHRQWDLVGETSTRLSFDRASASSIGLMYHTYHGLGLSFALVNGGRSTRMKPFIGIGFPIGF
jgi:hypothetical protein